MKVLELFSGIGGMHFACQEAAKELEVVAAVEINPVANKVYQFNFPSTKLLQKNIQSLTSEYVNKLAPEVVLMSPPCQPFTRNGLQKDLDDDRTNPLQHIISLLPHLDTIQFLLVENVKGFETSEARNMLINCLKKLDYHFQEFILSPTQFGVLNTRHRYYLLAKRSKFSFQTHSNVMESLPSCNQYESEHRKCFTTTVRNIGNIVDSTDVMTDVYKNHLVPMKALLKHVHILDIVTTDCERSCCFTKSYSHYLEGTGSVFSNLSKDKVRIALDKCKNCQGQELESNLASLNLRFFSPTEISKLMCFPRHRFQFPSSITKKQQYRLLGNSINVFVVSELIRLLLKNTEV